MHLLSSSSFLLLLTVADASSILKHQARQIPDVAPYAPKPAACPSTPLLRAGTGLGSAETAWFAKKKPKADAALQTWLKKFGTFNAASMPTIGSAVAGGFLRASLLGAGIHQQLDGNEGTGPMAGLLQAVSYESTLSGSAAYQAGLIQNNWGSIASLSNDLWQPNYAYGVKPAADNGTAASSQAIAEIVADCGTRAAAGYPVTLIDVYGRILGYSNLYPERGGVDLLMSDARNQSQFANADVPFPIMTAVGSASNATNCHPGSNGTQYEFTPFEFGSWDYGVSSFMDTKYLGTRMVAGTPATVAVCTTEFDNMGLIVGTSANTISKKCSNLDAIQDLTTLGSTFDSILELVTFTVNRVWYAAIPNPFFGQSSSPLVADQPELALVDGGNSGQVIPLWPYLQRPNLDVILVWDNYYDNATTKGTTGGQLYDTYQAAMKANLKRMPVIPPKRKFQDLGLNTRPGAFGCNNPNVLTFVYVPYMPYIKQVTKTANLTTTPEQTRNFVLNGNRLATNNGNAGWPKCAACIIMKKKATSLPSFCSACFTQYCYN